VVDRDIKTAKKGNPNYRGKEKEREIMKKMRKIFALLIAMVMTLGMGTKAFAASITITQDGSYQGTDGEAGRVYSYYKVFSADPAEDFTQDFEGGHDDGTAVTEQGEGKVAYTATPAVAAKLGTIDPTTKAWTTNAGNEWFDLTYISGTGNYSVQWREGVAVDADTVQAAAAWLIDNEAYENGPTEMAYADKKWTASGLTDGYYIVKGDTGANLVAVTGDDIEIKSKNTYPPVEKTQADEDENVQTDQDKNVAVGDVLTYTIKVTVPATAAVNETIAVYDKPSAGLELQGNVTVNPAGAAAAGTPEAGEAWRQIITVTDALKGQEVTFTFNMLVTDAALADATKENDGGLVYNTYESIPSKVNFKTYFSGIEKIDGTSKEALENVVFTLKENGTDFPVKLVGDYYVYDANGSADVKTNADGKIIIRGLDSDKKYTLTEKENPNPGYNMLAEPVELTLEEDKADNAYKTTDFIDVENNQGTVLPSTGGIGTTMFYVIGAALVLGAGIVMVCKRRVDA